MGKATYEEVHGAAKFAERTESCAFYLRHRTVLVEDALASAYYELVVGCPGFGFVFCRYLGDSAVRSSGKSSSPACAVEVIGSS